MSCLFEDLSCFANSDIFASVAESVKIVALLFEVFEAYTEGNFLLLKKT